LIINKLNQNKKINKKHAASKILVIFECGAKADEVKDPLI
jgi:hypothetical protein